MIQRQSLTAPNARAKTQPPACSPVKQRPLSIVSSRGWAYDVGVYLQTVLHVEAGMEHVRDLWHRDPWFASELFRQCGRQFRLAWAVDASTGGAHATGGLWLDFGAEGRMGLIPVSDGTDVVLQLAETLRQELWGRIFHGGRRRLRRFAASAKIRLE